MLMSSAWVSVCVLRDDRMIYLDNDTIVAPATPAGGALCIIRLSGERSIEICDSIFRGRKPLCEAKTATLHYGNIVDGEQVVDDVVVSIFRAPHSYTGEESVEISAHGSRYIVSKIISLLTARGARLAEAGEFTRRAFMAGRLDLSQAEAVADIIASTSQASHAIATTQMRGAYSAELRSLRDELIRITSLLELELDFSEEDVEFADRTELRTLLEKILRKVSSLAESFALGNALKEGVIVAIAGRPNVGKSTLLNRLAGEDRAMVSDIAGTTRDTIEITTNIDGVIYRFIDTAGMHSTDDKLEQMGIKRTEEALRKARIILWMRDFASVEANDDEAAGVQATGTTSGTDLAKYSMEENSMKKNSLEGYTPTGNQTILRVVNKIDLKTGGGVDCGTGTGVGADFSADFGSDFSAGSDSPTFYISAKSGEGVEQLIEAFKAINNTSAAYHGEVTVSSQRHYEALIQAQSSLQAALSALNLGISSDLLSEDIRQVMHHLGTITGEITSEDILKTIFAQFCIGK